MTTVTGVAGLRAARDRAQSLRWQFREFLRHPSPWLLVGYLVATIVARLVLGGFTAGDLYVVLGFLAAQPFVEWVIHVYVLHAKPKTVFGRRWDSAIARSHRAHHRDPKRLDLVFINIWALVILAPVTALLYHVLMPGRRLAVTAMVMSTALTLAYEWTHYLIHTDYAPRHWPYRRIQRAHRLHHFRNENYWYCVTTTVADHVLRTFPDKDAVEASPTARTLGVPVA